MHVERALEIESDRQAPDSLAVAGDAVREFGGEAPSAPKVPQIRLPFSRQSRPFSLSLPPRPPSLPPSPLPSWWQPALPVKAIPLGHAWIEGTVAPFERLSTQVTGLGKIVCVRKPCCSSFPFLQRRPTDEDGSDASSRLERLCPVSCA